MSLPKNFYNAVDARKMGLDDLDYIKDKMDQLVTLPPVTAADAGKYMVVSASGTWELSD